MVDIGSLLKKEFTYPSHTLDLEARLWLKNRFPEISNTIILYTQQDIREFVFNIAKLHVQLFRGQPYLELEKGEPEDNFQIYFLKPKKEWSQCRWIGDMWHYLLYHFSISPAFELFQTWLRDEITRIYICLECSKELSKQENIQILIQTRALEFLRVPYSIRRHLGQNSYLWQKYYFHAVEKHKTTRDSTQVILDWTSGSTTKQTFKKNCDATCNHSWEICVDHRLCLKSPRVYEWRKYENIDNPNTFYQDLSKQNVETVSVNQIKTPPHCRWDGVCHLHFHHIDDDDLIVSDQTGHYFRIHHACLREHSRID